MHKKLTFEQLFFNFLHQHKNGVVFIQSFWKSTIENNDSCIAENLLKEKTVPERYIIRSHLWEVPLKYYDKMKILQDDWEIYYNKHKHLIKEHENEL